MPAARSSSQMLAAAPTSDVRMRAATDDALSACCT
jgi:hypothetical protein